MEAGVRDERADAHGAVSEVSFVLLVLWRSAQGGRGQLYYFICGSRHFGSQSRSAHPDRDIDKML